jgi:uncharacterized protein (DUF2141 family)
MKHPVALTLLLTLVSLVSVPAFAKGGAIELTITGLENTRGDIRCALFVESNYLDGQGNKGVLGTFTGDSKAVCVFEDIPPGTYAIAIHHDQNGDGEMETNMFGIPKEGFGMSRNARGSFGPPDFEDAAFQYRGGSKKLTAKMSY